MALRVMNKYLESIINTCGSVKAILYLRLLSFTESIFFPIPTDALLAPMVISGKHNWISISITATIWSVLGGIVGYYLGYYLYDIFLKPNFDNLSLDLSCSDFILSIVVTLSNSIDRIDV